MMVQKTGSTIKVIEVYLLTWSTGWSDQHQCRPRVCLHSRDPNLQFRPSISLSWSDQGNLMICDDVENGIVIYDNPRLDELGRVRAERAEKRSSPIPGASVRTSLTNAMVTIQPDQTSPEESHIDQMMTCPAQSIEVSSRKLFPSLASCISLANYYFFHYLIFSLCCGKIFPCN